MIINGASFIITKNKIDWRIGIDIHETDYAVKRIYHFVKDKLTPTADDREYDELVALFKKEYHEQVIRDYYSVSK